MRHLNERCEAVEMPYSCLRMDFDQRQKTRSRILATNGEIVGVHIQRGTCLKDGDHLRSSDGKVFVVRAKRESLSVVASTDPLQLARAAYHLGNRHVRLQVAKDQVSYQADHVIDDMLMRLGLPVVRLELPFEPEPGAYHRHAHPSGGTHHAHAHVSEGDHAHFQPSHALTQDTEERSPPARARRVES